MPVSPLEELRRSAVARSLFPATSLRRAIDRLAFVQADPIRAPARAQDLILRHRVERYRAGDLERAYASLGVEEDTFYAYGFMTPDVRRLLHPRRKRRATRLETRVLDVVGRLGVAHPADLEEHFRPRRVRNAWGGRSKATTAALDALHHYGLLRVAERRNGTRVYAPAAPMDPLPPEERLRRIIVHVARILDPIPMRTLRAVTVRFRRLGSAVDAIADLVRRGELRTDAVEGVTYVSPTSESADNEESAPQVRFLAPFDPLVWDRARFEHVWGWRYTFEAYTPPPKRVRGYYAMPLLWRDAIIGWANAAVVDGRLDVQVGYVSGARPRDARFRSELDAEVERLRGFLGRATPE